MSHDSEFGDVLFQRSSNSSTVGFWTGVSLKSPATKSKLYSFSVNALVLGAWRCTVGHISLPSNMLASVSVVSSYLFNYVSRNCKSCIFLQRYKTTPLNGLCSKLFCSLFAAAMDMVQLSPAAKQQVQSWLSPQPLWPFQNCCSWVFFSGLESLACIPRSP